MASLIQGNEFAAPSTASFGDSNNEESAETATTGTRVLAPAIPAPGGATSSNQTSPARSMADVIGNVESSSGSTPVSYEVVTMSPVKSDAPTTMLDAKNFPVWPDIQDWRSAISDSSVNILDSSVIENKVA